MSERTTPLVKNDGVAVGRGRTFDFHPGPNVSYTITEVDSEVDITISATGPTAESRGAVLFSSSGLTDVASVICWRAPYACSVTAVYGYRVGGSGAVVNARRNGASNHLAASLSLTGADAWTSGGAVQNAAYALGDKLEVMFVSYAGGPTQVGIQVDFEVT
jgi:hypothetical protein